MLLAFAEDPSGAFDDRRVALATRGRSLAAFSGLLFLWKWGAKTVGKFRDDPEFWMHFPRRTARMRALRASRSCCRLAGRLMQAELAEP